jgi:predicted RNA-binding Zn ribbon-like protein
MSRDIVRAQTQFFGGRICFDFANTLDWRTSGDPQELIPDYAAFLSWSERRGTLSRVAVKRLRPRAASADAVMQRVYALRREIWAISEDLQNGKSIDTQFINRMLAAAPRQPNIVRESQAHRYALKGIDLNEPLWPVLWSLTAVLTSEDAARIGCCKAEGCGWFFVDESPNKTRRWCSSEVCGNRERARRSYAKRRRPIATKE